jgi:hypothetical protein
MLVVAEHNSRGMASNMNVKTKRTMNYLIYRTTLLSVLTFLLATQVGLAQCGNLYISAVFDGPLAGGTPKGVQLCATADIADLSLYGIGSANNGGGTDGVEFPFPPDALLAGECIWVGNEEAQFTNYFGFAPCYNTGAMSVNGDDAIELFCDPAGDPTNAGVVEDLFGDINVDGNGECWE